MPGEKEIIYTIDALIQRIISSEKQYDLSKIVSAYELASKAHEGQFRSSGDPYISHPVAVAYILLELGMDTDTICAALLHDVVEDTDTTLEQLRSLFGQDVAMLVDGVTKLGKIPLSTKEEQQAENVRKILLAMSQDIRVIIIKLCDRLHNMRTLHHRPPEKQRSTALETMNIYAPIAHRLGIRAVKDEIEDIAFRILDPYAYAEIEQMMEIKKDEREAFIESIKKRIAERFASAVFERPPQIDGRVKSIYGIYKKIYLKGKSFEEIYDKYAVRIIVSTVEECYNSLGIIHDMFRPLPNRFKDYISTPKSNMYQSLHTTVISRDAIPFEVQIRTWEMHYTAEYGIAAHWKYKQGISRKDKMDDKLAWVRQVIEAQQETDDVEEIVRTIKTDLAAEDVFAFTPKGDMITLPLDATVIDFAYAIHTQVGNKMSGAKADGKMVSLDHKIQPGEIIEIITSKDPNHGPKRAWLDMVKTNEARSKIRSWFKKERREENIVNGKEELEKEFRRNGIHVPEDKLETFLADDMRRHNCETLDDYYAAIGYGGVHLSKILQRLKDKYLKLYGDRQQSATVSDIVTQANSKQKSGIIVEGIDNCLIKFSQCCNPLPGDEIIGFITRGHGVSIHKKDCINYRTAIKNGAEADRWIAVHWTSVKETAFRATLDIVAYDRDALVADIASAVADSRIPMHEISARALKNGNANVVATVSVSGVEQLQGLINRLKKIRDVISVDRTGK